MVGHVIERTVANRDIAWLLAHQPAARQHPPIGVQQAIVRGLLNDPCPFFRLASKCSSKSRRVFHSGGLNFGPPGGWMSSSSMFTTTVRVYGGYEIR